MKLQSDTVSHPMNPFIQVSLLGSIHCKESLVWFETSGLISESSLGLLLGILLLSCVGEILQHCVCRSGPFT